MALCITRLKVTDEGFVYKIVELMCGGKMLDGLDEAFCQQTSMPCGKGHYSFCDHGNFCTCILPHIFVLLNCLLFTPRNMIVSCCPVHII
jgi:hypothetical protein